MNRKAIFYALISAALFGLSTPAAKRLLGLVDPIILAGLLYCGAGIGVSILRRLIPAIQSSASREVSLRERIFHGWQGLLPPGALPDPYC
jgi:drug/metabolite transporter (DMT)-like permease